MKKIIVYGITESLFRQYCSVCEASGVDMISIDDHMLERKLGELFSCSSGNTFVASAIQRPIMFLKGFDLDQMTALMTCFSRKGIPYQGIKMMLTETNRNWTVRRLIGEADREYRYYQRIEHINKQLGEIKTVDVKRLSVTEQAEYTEVIMKALGAVKGQEENIFILDQIIAKLQAFLNICKNRLC